MGSSLSYLWYSIWVAKSLLKNGSRIRIGVGTNVRVKKDPWLPIQGDKRVNSTMLEGYKEMKVYELMNESHTSWDVQKIQLFLNRTKANVILLIPLSQIRIMDTCI